MSQWVWLRLHLLTRSILSQTMQLLTLSRYTLRTHLGALSRTLTQSKTLKATLWETSHSTLYHLIAMSWLDNSHLTTSQISTSPAQQAKPTQSRLRAQLVTIHQLMTKLHSTWQSKIHALMKTSSGLRNLFFWTSPTKFMNGTHSVMNSLTMHSQFKLIRLITSSVAVSLTPQLSMVVQLTRNHPLQSTTLVHLERIMFTLRTRPCLIWLMAQMYSHTLVLFSLVGRLFQV